MTGVKAYCQNVFGFEYYSNSKDTVLVTKVYPNSPAEKCGLKKGDFLNLLNNIPLSFKSLEDLQKILTAAPIVNNSMTYYRNGFKSFTCSINKAPLQSFEFSCVSENCNNGNCTLQSIRGYKIIGNCKNGIINGEAKFYVNDKLYFSGSVKDNVREGNGIEYNKEYTFEGNYTDGLKEGKGKIIFNDNTSLVGNWIKGNLEGKAELYNTKKELWKKRVYENGKLISEEELKTSIPQVSAKAKELTKSPALVKEILADKDQTSAWDWETYYFNSVNIKKVGLVAMRQKPPLSKSDYKKYGQHVYAKLSPKALEKAVEQCAFENWPEFYKNYKNPDELFKGPFPNLTVEKLFDFQVEKDNGEYKSEYYIYSVIFIRDKKNSYAPKELLSDDGIGFFMCVPKYVIQDTKDKFYSYAPFTMDNFEKVRGFKNWTTKKQVYIFDMESVKESFDAGWIGDSEIKKNLNLNDAELQQLKELCDKKNRPDGLKTNEDIKSAQRNGKFLDAVVYNLLGDESSKILYMPSSENQHLPYSIRPKNNDGWYFCSSSNIDKEAPNEKTRSRILATTDASMDAYRIEQAAREEKMKKDAADLAEWKLNNEFKGVAIYQLSGGNYNNTVDPYSYKVVSIFGPPNQKILQIDRKELDKLVGEDEKSTIKFDYQKGMTEEKAENFITNTTGSHRFSINNNYIYTIPKRDNNSANQKDTYLEELDKQLEENNNQIKKMLIDTQDDKQIKK